MYSIKLSLMGIKGMEQEEMALLSLGLEETRAVINKVQLDLKGEAGMAHQKRQSMLPGSVKLLCN